MTSRCCAVLTLALACAAPALAQQPAVAGRIKTVSGSAFVVRDGGLIPAKAGQDVFEADGLRTESDGQLGVTMKDETRLSLGPSSELRLERFAYSPPQGRFEFAVRIMRGVAAYVSGRIAKLSPDSIRLETPSSIIGVRGTSLAIRVSS